MRKQSVLGQIGIPASLVVFIYIFSTMFWNVITLYQAAERDLLVQINHEVDELQSTLRVPLWNLDEESLRSIIRTKAGNTSVIAITISDNQANAWTISRDSAGLLRETETPYQLAAQSPELFTQEREVWYQNEKIGRVVIVMSIQERRQQALIAIQSQVTTLVFLYVAAVATLFLSWRRVGKRLESMMATVSAFSLNQAGVRMAEGRNDELGYLARGFNTMADQVFASTQARENEIRSRTEKLVEAEKLALVGSLVAGVAHEINTPVGNCITSTTWLQQRLEDIRSKVEAAHLRKDEMDSFLQDAAETLRIMSSSLSRTASLIQAFKQIGADQVMDEHRQINLASFLNDLLLSLQPTYKRRAQTCRIDCPGQISLNTSPGALYQVVTNLVVNAYTHAFPENEPGCISIQARTTEEPPHHVLITVSDDGKGMAPDIQEKAFLPFFTTRRGNGGTGLGLSITSNLVNRLGGTITLSSTPGKGSIFSITLPLISNT